MTGTMINAVHGKLYRSLALTIASTAVGACVNACPISRNPFGFEDFSSIPTVDNARASVWTRELGSAGDPNAENWVPDPSPGSHLITAGSLNGHWYGRRKIGEGIAKVQEKDGRLYVRYTETDGANAGTIWMFESARQGKLLHGQMRNVTNDEDEELEFFGVIVAPDRIDGLVGGDRWDFRR